jgi:multimeric flavodoxin WrbA
MKITVFNGSPWGREGHTYVMARQFLEGAAEAGAKTEAVELITEQIKPCNRCGVCLYSTPGKCEINDGMSKLIKKFMASDVVAFATPVYIDNVTSLMKLFIDRMMPVMEPHYEKDRDGQYRRRGRYKTYPKFVVISSCAMPEQSNFQVLRLFFERMARTMHSEVVGEIYRGAAGVLLLSKEELRFKPAVKEYFKLLRAAGQELVRTGMISRQTSQKLGEPIIDADEFVEYANTMWDRILPKHRLKVLS